MAVGSLGGALALASALVLSPAAAAAGPARGAARPAATPAAGVEDAGVVRAAAGGVTIDWTRGELEAAGAAVADLGAPSVAIARVGAERRAGERAVAALVRAARGLKLAGGGTLGTAMGKDAALAARVEAALVAARSAEVIHGSDGSSRVVRAAALEALRVARRGAEPPVGTPAADAPTALVVEAVAALGEPALGLALRAGDERYAGPTVYHRDAAAASRDARLGGRVVRGAATRLDDGELHVDGALAAALPAARTGGALVVVVLADRPASRKEK